MREPGVAPSITRATESIMGTFGAGGSVYSNAAYLPRVSLTPNTRKMVSLLKNLTEGKQGQGDNIRPIGQAAAITAMEQLHKVRCGLKMFPHDVLRMETTEESNRSGGVAFKSMRAVQEGLHFPSDLGTFAFRQCIRVCAKLCKLKPTNKMEGNRLLDLNRI